VVKATQLDMCYIKLTCTLGIRVCSITLICDIFTVIFLSVCDLLFIAFNHRCGRNVGSRRC